MYFNVSVKKFTLSLHKIINIHLMKKESKEMLKTIISNQELIMKALKIETPLKQPLKKALPTKTIKKALIKKTGAK